MIKICEDRVIPMKPNRIKNPTKRLNFALYRGKYGSFWSV